MSELLHGQSLLDPPSMDTGQNPEEHAEYLGYSLDFITAPSPEVSERPDCQTWVSLLSPQVYGLPLEI
ncbi:MAG: hypothetical protein QF447_07125 [Candidatus Thioglobus sp.]|nr:hypothetical protein [Candidatus Thioglobus sp.]